MDPVHYLLVHYRDYVAFQNFQKISQVRSSVQ
jgi:hypothetical protein